jgi:hypothetical protein
MVQIPDENLKISLNAKMNIFMVDRVIEELTKRISGVGQDLVNLQNDCLQNKTLHPDEVNFIMENTNRLFIELQEFMEKECRSFRGSI